MHSSNISIWRKIHILFIFQNGDTDSCNYKSMTGRQYSVKRLSEKFNVVSMKETFRSSENVFIENEAFQELKDDDLWSLLRLPTTIY